MPDPMTVAIATAVAGKVAETLTDQVKPALAQLTRRIRAKFSHQPDALAVLDAAGTEPSPPALVTQLAALLDQAAHDDPTFGADLRNLWQRVQIEISHTTGDTSNVFTGSATKVVQLRDVSGDLNIS